MTNGRPRQSIMPRGSSQRIAIKPQTSIIQIYTLYLVRLAGRPSTGYGAASMTRPALGAKRRAVMAIEVRGTKNFHAGILFLPEDLAAYSRLHHLSCANYKLP